MPATEVIERARGTCLIAKFAACKVIFQPSLEVNGRRRLPFVTGESVVEMDAIHAEPVLTIIRRLQLRLVLMLPLTGRFYAFLTGVTVWCTWSSSNS